ncbi:hypothetical protein K493DRAFT_352701 [Basidiobolus meristosporus CBS 931.73]|uniref:Uncharacterized protein n=1 Tax=Basidiobolus meristosporus CBS 931.73 TaxID=1314790 RepID=A0A1Y1Y9E1_9FUNG|nr:hypothetical protein K493DRAFT_352701 [Basidiobolus meristosporus CBS 931.73]|eukprot:ORX94184.1 hypothetical protein K493DRAFT_352701 [Basidiobolus meristosporus CBS 931.73]
MTATDQEITGGIMTVRKEDIGMLTTGMRDTTATVTGLMIDLEYESYRRGEYQREHSDDRYRHEPDNGDEDWEYIEDRNGGIRDDGDDMKGGGRRDDSKTDHSEQLPRTGSPAGGDGDLTNDNEGGSHSIGDDAGGTPSNNDTSKPGGQPSGDETNLLGNDRCHGNLVDGKVDLLGINADICIGLGAGGTSRPHDGLPSGPASDKVGDTVKNIAGGLPGNKLINGSKGSDGQGSPAGVSEDLTRGSPSIPDGSNTSGDNTGQISDWTGSEAGRCEGIAVKVRQLLGIDADAVVCLGNLIKVDLNVHGGDNGHKGLIGGVIDNVSLGKDVEGRRREYCETIKAHANILGIKLLFILSAASVISAASVAERDYSLVEEGDHYRPRNGWTDYDRQEGRYQDVDYRDERDYRHSDRFDDDLEYDSHRRGEYQREHFGDRYRHGSGNGDEEWEYTEDRDGGIRGIDADDMKGEDQRDSNKTDHSEQPPHTASPAGGDGDLTNDNEGGSHSTDGDASGTPSNNDTSKLGGQPSGDETNLSGNDRCHGNLVDGKVDLLGINADICIGLGAGGTSRPHDGLPSGPASDKVGDTVKNIAGGLPMDKSINGSKGSDGPGSPAGVTEDLNRGSPSIPDVSNTSGDHTGQDGEWNGSDVSRCEDIAVKVRQLLGIDADAVVCLGNLIKVDLNVHGGDNSPKRLIGGVIDNVSLGKDVEGRRREYCETIKAHANILGIKVDAVVCLPDILIHL